jgi:hypothetical protein
VILTLSNDYKKSVPAKERIFVFRQYGIEEQQRIKKCNHPIEPDRAVRYPEIT